jgi:hypothetical protein
MTNDKAWIPWHLPIQILLVAKFDQQIPGEFFETVNMLLFEIISPVPDNPFANVLIRFFFPRLSSRLPKFFPDVHAFKTVAINDSLQHGVR